MLRFDLRLQRGELDLRAQGEVAGLVGVVGANGAGKSTLLHALAGLLGARGRIALDDEVWLDEHRRVPTRRRGVGLVFQDLRLLPHLDVRANLGFRARAADVERVVEQLELGPLLRRPVHALSGGEARRVAVGRALAHRPRVLLLDEPLSGLDGDRRAALIPWIRTVVRDVGIPTLWVSHDVPALLAAADELLVLESGRTVEQGPVHAILGGVAGDRARRLGLHNVLDLHRDGDTVRWGPLPIQTASSEADRVLLDPDEPIVAASRPGPTSARNVLEGPVVRVADRPWGAALSVDVGGPVPLVVHVTRASLRELDLVLGRHVWLLIKATALRAPSGR